MHGRKCDKLKVLQIAFKPDWTKHAKAAPFKRNDKMLEVLPIGVMVFPARASKTTLPTRHECSAYRSGSSELAARERRRISTKP
jgi:hypothetical protein